MVFQLFYLTWAIDQRANVDKIVNKGFGLKLQIGNITNENVVKSLKLLLESDIYSTNIKKFSKLYHDRPLSSEDNAVYWLEYVLRHKGAKHLQSKALELNFIEYYLFDIYGLIFVSFFSILWILNILEEKLKQQ